MIGIVSLLFGLGALTLSDFMNDQALQTAGKSMVQSFREARTQAVAQRLDGPWGIYFDNGSDPRGYVLFQGNTYASRDTDYDQTTIFHKAIVFDQISLNGGGQEVVFSKRSGLTGDHGSVRLASQTETLDITINSLGLIDFDF